MSIKLSGPGFEPMDKLSRVVQPNTNRNQTLMEHWNQTVAPGNTVYVDGDFGAEAWVKFLSSVSCPDLSDRKD